ncbi:MAG: YybH family protein [Chitinophagales bacterium]
MKNLFFVLLCVTIFSCSQSNSGNTNNAAAPNKDSLVATLMAADKAWNDASHQKGYFHSRIDFADENGIETATNEMPLVGKSAITDYAATHSDSALKVQWIATKGDVAASGDLGYTYGSYTDQMKTKAGKDTTVHGVYITVWKRQADGSWKYLADMGTDTPQEVK